MSVHEIAARDRAAAGDLLDRHDMMAIFGLSESNYYRRAERGEFDRFKVEAPVGPRCFSGVKVYRYMQGEHVEESVPVFGRKRRIS